MLFITYMQASSSYLRDGDRSCSAAGEPHAVGILPSLTLHQQLEILLQQFQALPPLPDTAFLSQISAQHMTGSNMHALMLKQEPLGTVQRPAISIAAQTTALLQANMSWPAGASRYSAVLAAAHPTGAPTTYPMQQPQIKGATLLYLLLHQQLPTSALQQSAVIAAAWAPQMIALPVLGMAAYGEPLFSLLSMP